MIKKQIKQMVRIDHKTIIEVPLGMNAEEAKNNFILKMEENRRKYDPQKMPIIWK
jgi:hypothetical protein